MSPYRKNMTSDELAEEVLIKLTTIEDGLRTLWAINQHFQKQMQDKYDRLIVHYARLHGEIKFRNRMLNVIIQQNDQRCQAVQELVEHFRKERDDADWWKHGSEDGE